MNTRKISMLLAAILAVSVASCGESAATTDTTAVPEVETTKPVDPSDDELPSDLDFGGETVTFFYRAEIVDEFSVEEQNGDVVNDALYNSHRAVEERLNVKLETVTMNGQNGEDRNTFMNHITSTVMAGDDAYDWVDLMIGNSPVKMQEGIFADLLTNPYIDVTKPYYMRGLADLVTVDGKLYFMSGDASLGYLQDAFCIIYNKRLADELGIGNLYELVEKGQWTIDKLMEFTELAGKDIDSNGVWSDDDQLGLRLYTDIHISGFIASAEMHMFTEQNGEWVFDMSSDRTASIIEKLYKLVNETPGALLVNGTTPAKFPEGKTLFITAQFDDTITYLRDMKDPYGILPYPKFEASQEHYYSNARSTHNAFSMPITCGDPNMAGAVMEALSSQNYKTVTPAYYEVALKTKYTTDDESSRMYDIIHEGFTLDYGYIFSNVVKNPALSVFIKSVTQGNFASKLAEYEPAIKEAQKTYMETIRENIK
ncbi:MAG: hypothetical protein E7632_07100 [Ruminococcaceae bacterium]|nr:hypothetical protein [Oscillospiraceae bacterium]